MHNGTQDLAKILQIAGCQYNWKLIQLPNLSQTIENEGKNYNKWQSSQNLLGVSKIIA